MRATVTVDPENRELNELLDRVASGDASEVILERDGEPVAVLRASLSLLEMIKKLHAGNMDIPSDEIEAEIARAIRDVREGRDDE